MAGSITSTYISGTVATLAGIGFTICTLSHSTQVTQKGVYRLSVYASLGGSVAATDANNIVVTVGSTTFTVPVAAADGGYGPYFLNLSLDGATDVVAKVGAANNTAAYSVTLVADYLGIAGGRGN